MDDLDVLALVDKDELIEFVVSEINNWCEYAQEAVAEQLDKNVIEREMDERDLLPTFTDMLLDQEEVDVLGELLNFGTTPIEKDWLSKKLNELKDSIATYSYLNEV